MVIGALPGELGSASSLGYAPRDPFMQTDFGSHRALGCERAGLIEADTVSHCVRDEANDQCALGSYSRLRLSGVGVEPIVNKYIRPRSIGPKMHPAIFWRLTKAKVEVLVDCHIGTYAAGRM